MIKGPKISGGSKNYPGNRRLYNTSTTPTGVKILHLTRKMASPGEQIREDKKASSTVAYSKINSWCHTEFKEYEFSHRWTVANFSDREKYNGNKIVLESPPFSPEGKPGEQWTVQLIPCQPGGSPVRYYAGIFVALVNVADTQKLWVKYKFTIPSVQNDKDVSREASGYSQISKGQHYGWPNFIQKDVLLKLGNGYLIDDTLTIYCTISVKLLDSPEHKTGTISRGPVQDFGLLGKLNEARQKGLFTDVILVADSMEFKAHRAVLAVQSSFFNTRFQERWDQGDNKIQMVDISSSTLESILEFIYTGQCDINSSNIEVLLAASHEYGIDHLQLVCEKHLCLELKIENIVSMLIVADTYQAQQLKTVCFDFCILHSSLLLGSAEWKKLKKSKQHEKLVMDILEELLKRKC